MASSLLIAGVLQLVHGSQVPRESVVIEPQGGVDDVSDMEGRGAGHAHGRAMRMEKRPGRLAHIVPDKFLNVSESSDALKSALFHLSGMPHGLENSEALFERQEDIGTTTPNVDAELNNLTGMMRDTENDMSGVKNESGNGSIAGNVSNETNPFLTEPSYKLVPGWKDESGPIVGWKGGDVIVTILYIVTCGYGVFNILAFMGLPFPKPFEPHVFTPEDDEAMMKHRDPESEKPPDNSAYDIPALYMMRYPSLRLFLATYTILCNFWIFYEDPVPDSMRHADLPGVGNIMTFVFTRWPDNDPGLCVLKVFNVLLCSFLGCVFGRQVVHHKFLRNVCGLQAFSGCKGTWMTMLFTWAFFCFCWSWMIWNPILGAIADRETYDKCFSRSELVMSNKSFCDMAAFGTWAGDSITLVMVFDQILQDWSQYGWWRPGLRNWWMTVRIKFSLGFIAVGTLILVLMWHVVEGGPAYDSGWGEAFSTDEFSRAMLAGVIWWNDMMIVMMDWEFPTFDSGLAIKAPFVNSETWHLKPPDTLTERLSEEARDFFQLKVTGKWMQYGVLFLVMCLDANMLKNQVLYDPPLYAQYVESSGRVWVIQDYDDANLRMPDYLETGNGTFLTVLDYEMRAPKRVFPPENKRDVRLFKRYSNVWHYAVRCFLGFFPTALGFILLYILIKKYNKEPVWRKKQRAMKKIKAAAAFMKGGALKTVQDPNWKPPEDEVTKDSGAGSSGIAKEEQPMPPPGAPAEAMPPPGPPGPPQDGMPPPGSDMPPPDPAGAASDAPPGPPS